MQGQSRRAPSTRPFSHSVRTWQRNPTYKRALVFICQHPVVSYLLLLASLAAISTLVQSIFIPAFTPPSTPTSLESQTVYAGGDIKLPIDDWKWLYKWEDDLPQHDLTLPFPEGKTGRFIKFSTQSQGVDNIMNDVLMYTHLAHESGMSYVFQDLTSSLQVSNAAGRRFPLNAIMEGPAAGGSWPQGDTAPRSVSERWYDVVCPVAERLVIESYKIQQAVASANGSAVFAHWKKYLTDSPARCIDIVHKEGDTAPQRLWESSKLASMWDGPIGFAKSATSRLMRGSAIVRAAVERNLPLFRTGSTPPVDETLPEGTFNRMLAIHLRRGDSINTCKDMSRLKSTFSSWALLPELTDAFVPPAGRSDSKSTAENNALYMSHCFPNIEQIVTKIRSVRKEFLGGGKDRKLDVLFVGTDDQTPWLKQLKARLTADGWKTIVSTSQLKLDSEQSTVDLMVDMEIARKAAVFIGNGFSSTTSNIVRPRMVDGRHSSTTRFW